MTTKFIDVLLYPHYVHIGSLKYTSPIICDILTDHRILLDHISWDGSLDLPDKGCLIRASSMLKISLDDLAVKADRMGHLVFYDDKILIDGKLVPITDSKAFKKLSDWLNTL